MVRVLSYNTQRSFSVHAGLLGTGSTSQFAVIALQEPWYYPHGQILCPKAS